MSLDTGNAVSTINLSTTLKSSVSERPTVVRLQNKVQTPAKKPATIQKPQKQLSNDETCGKTIHGSTQSLVIGGKEVSRGDFPW